MIALIVMAFFIFVGMWLLWAATWDAWQQWRSDNRKEHL